MILSLLAWAFFGIIIGAIAKRITPGEKPQGLLATMGVGILGSYFGGIIKWITFGGSEISPGGVLFSVVGGVVFLLIYNFVQKNQ
jgi:uncharacterized membrane protein YeaQ/YmgE (transglycosylase-associated protein family)